MTKMGRNVVLIVLDAVRKDYFDEYSPRLRELSDVSFEECRSVSSWSVPSHASMFTGELPCVHGNHSGQINYQSLDDHGLLLDDLNGHTTLGVSANTYANSAFGFDTHFDRFTDVYPGVRFTSGLDVRQVARSSDNSGLRAYFEFLFQSFQHERPARSLVNGAASWIQMITHSTVIPNLFDDGAKTVSRSALELVRDAADPYFLFMNLMDAHDPHGVTRGHDLSLLDADRLWTSAKMDFTFNVNRQRGGDDRNIHNFREYYKVAIDYLDRVVSEIVQEVISKSERETTIIITSDHGENLAFKDDRRQMGHVYTKHITEGLLHVPFEIINPPDGYDSTETEYFSHLQLPELVLGLSKGQTPDVFREAIPVEIIGMGTLDIDLLIDSAPGEDVGDWDNFLRGAYLKGGRVDWTSDTEEDMPKEALDLFPVSMASYSKQIEDTSANIEVDDNVTERLKQLGYR